MASHAKPFRFGCIAAAFLALAWTATGQAQEPQPAAADVEAPPAGAAADAAATPARKPIEIRDEPRTIDPATLVPKELAKRATVDFSDSSLGEVAQWLRDEQGLAVLFDQEALADQGTLLSDPVSDRLNDDPLYLLLNRLAVLNLAWYMEDDILHITSAEEAEQQVITKSYAAGDLFDAGYQADDLLEAMTFLDQPSWEDQGGSGSAQFLGDVLFVLQSREVHREVAGLLAALRNHGRRTFVPDPPQNEKLRTALNQVVTAEFRDTPLVAAVQELARQAGADLRLDIRALRELGLRGRETVSLSLADRKLRTVLQVLLTNYDLTWALRDGVLWVTSQDDESQQVKAAIFDVRDLCRDESESNALAGAVTQQTAPTTWEDQGGPGALTFPKPGTMLVVQTQRVLDDILLLLDRYREAPVAEDLAKWLPQLVAPESWQEPERPEAVGTIIRLASATAPGLAQGSFASVEKETTAETPISQAVLIIRQTRQIHEQIEEVIRRVERGDPPINNPDDPFGGQGGGGGFGGGLF